MKQENTSQLELFSVTKEQGAADTRLSKAFLVYLKTYEKIILMIMVFIVASVVSFSLGVENGKKIAALNTDNSPKTAVQIASPLAPPPAVKPVQPHSSQTTVQTPKVTTPAQKVKEQPLVYTIQLASYQTKEHARDAAQALKKTGLTPVLTVKGKYTVLCVGKFTNKETAQVLLARLKKQYQSCFLRRL